MESGEIGSGARLPAERALARSLRVDRMTVARAYEELVSEGLVERQVGRGSLVSGTLSPGSADSEGAGPAASILHWTDTFASRAGSMSPHALGTLHAPAPESSINLSSLFPDPSLFPLKEFREAMDNVLRREGARLLGYGAASGYPPLRRYLAGSLRERGMEVAPEEIVVTNGSQQGIDLVARTFLDPGDRVVLEDPTYTGAVQVFQSHGAQVAGTPVDSQGMVPERLEEVLRRRGARLIYLIPNFQNPTSGTMDLERRRRLLEVALRYGVPILEDDFGGDLRYEGEQQPSLRALDHGSEGVIYLSTFAKKLVPGLRVGWLAAPLEAARRLTYMKQVTDWSTSLLLQGALYEFCRRGHLDRHLKRVVREYRRRRDVMIASMERHFPGEVRWTRPQGGLVIWVTLPAGVDADEAATEAEAQGVLVGRGDLFSVSGGSRNNLRLVFGQASPEAIRKGIRVLGTILKRKVKEAVGVAWSGAPEPLPII
jgi:GntR family transcriptional regulator/MocR family aminotransferase